MKTLPHLIAALLLLALWAGCGDRLVDRMRTEGVQTDASIAFKRESGNGRSRIYSFTLYYFAQDRTSLAAERAQEARMRDSSPQVTERMDKWDPLAGGLGEFQSVDIVVTPGIFDQFREGERIKVRYLPQDPTQVMLEAQL
jgi:hypothetical protein